MKARARLILAVAVLLLLAFGADQWRRAHLESSQDRNILAAARKHGLDPALIKAVVWRESRFDPRARGSKGELGLMQIMEGTGREWAGAQHVLLYTKFALLDPAKNLDCGAWYLHKALARYTQADNPVPYALAEFNAGRGKVLKWMSGAAATNSAAFIEQIGFPATRDYVRAIERRREKYAVQFRERK